MAIFDVMTIEDGVVDERYSASVIRCLLKEEERQGHPLGRDSYINQMSVRQLDALVHGRTDA